jgi:hypothetical protein
MRRLSFSVLIAAVVGLVASLHEFAFWAWVTATPLEAEGLASAQRRAGWWAAAAAGCVLFPVASVVALARSYRLRREA